MAAKPFESRIQDLVYNVDAGVGLRLIKTGLYYLFIFVVLLLYTATQFKGFREAESMEYAQLGRNLMVHKSMVTQCIRPASMWYLIEHSKARNPQVDRHPDILHPPLYPAVLAGVFKIFGAEFGPGQKGGVFTPEFMVIGMGHIFTVLTGILVFLTGRRLFEKGVALLAVTLFFLSNTVWSDAISGLNISMLMFWAMLCFYTAVLAITRFTEGEGKGRWFVPFLISILACIAAFLTRYIGIVLLPGLMLVYGIAFGRRGWPWIFAVLGLFVLGVAPWIVRNVQVSGGPMGLVPYMTLAETKSFEMNTFERSLAPVFKSESMLGRFNDAGVQQKWMLQLAELYSGNLLRLGDGLVIAMFLCSFFFRFTVFRVHILRWGLALSILLLLVLAALFGETSARALHIFWPIVLLYGVAFFRLLLDRLQFTVRIFNLGVNTLFAGMLALPLIFTLMPPRASVPYPPYFPPFINHIDRMIQPGELLCTDMPWATAWYGQMNSVHLPATVDEFYEINDYTKRISGIYFTTLTRNQPFIRTLATGPYRSWFPILEGRIPNDFPLTEGFPINNLDQLFLSDRRRWEEL